MKKGVTLALSLALTVSMIGCSSDAKNESSKDPQTSSADAGTAKPGEPVKIKFYTYKANKPEEPFVQAVDAFNKLQKDVQVEYVGLVQNNDSVEFMNKLDVLMASGEKVDVIHTANMEDLIARAARGVVEPLDSYYQKNSINPKDEYVLNPSINGKTYGIIATSSQMLVAFNKNHLEEAGLKLPEMGWTWDDFREYAKKLTTKDHYGAYFHNWGEYPNIIAYNELPHPQLKEDGTPNFDHPSFQYFFELRRAMEKTDKSVQPYSDILAAKNHILQPFFAGKASMIPVGSFIIRAGTLKDKFPHDFQTVYAPMPRSSKDAEMGLTNISGNYLAIGANSKQKEASFQFIRWLTTEGASYLKDIPGWKKADGKKLLNEYFGEYSKLIDIDSLSNTMFDPRVKMLPTSVSVSYGADLKTVVENAFTKYILEDIKFEDARKFMTDEANKIIKKSRK